jgi:spermidine synthase
VHHVSARYEELDRRPTAMGEISLRRRWEPALRVEVHEVRLGEEFLMSSLFTVAEEELARLGLAATTGGELDVVVGGLGLGCTAVAALEDPRVRSLRVVDALEAVIGWHLDGVLPLAATLTGDARCELVHGDFFALAATGALGPAHVVLLDVDHSPRAVLHPSHAPFYTADGLRRLAAGLHPGGVFALWSDDPPDHDLLEVLGAVFATARADVVTFANPYTGGESANTVYVATTAG